MHGFRRHDEASTSRRILERPAHHGDQARLVPEWPAAAVTNALAENSMVMLYPAGTYEIYGVRLCSRNLLTTVHHLALRSP